VTESQSSDYRDPKPKSGSRESDVTTLQEAVDDIGIDREALRALAESDARTSEVARTILKKTE
jgi:hypothetical protein